jgi:hypothetical protein
MEKKGQEAAPAVEAPPAPKAVKAIKAVVADRPPPKASDRYWLGLVAGGPLSYWSVPGATFHVETGQYIPTGDPEHPYQMNRSPGGLADLLPDVVRGIQEYVGAHVCRWRGAIGDLRSGFELVRTSDPGYDGGRASDVPMGRYCYMVRQDHSGTFGGAPPEPMA